MQVDTQTEKEPKRPTVTQKNNQTESETGIHAGRYTDRERAQETDSDT